LKLLEKLAQQSKSSLIAACLLMVAGLGCADYLAGSNYSFSLFYLFPIGLTAWYAGGWPGGLMAAASVIAWSMAVVPTNSHHLSHLAMLWNAAIQFDVFLIVALLLTALKKFQQRLHEQVELRTRALRLEMDEHKHTAQQLRTSEQQFRQLAAAITEVFWLTDVSRTRMIYISPGYEQIWGRTCASLYATPHEWMESIHPEDRARVFKASSAKQPTGEYDEEYRIVRPDGSHRWIRDRAFPVRDETGKIYRIAGIAEDITTRRQLREEVLEIAEREQQRIGHDLHDGLCQHLLATAVTSKLLEGKLAAQSLPEAAAAGEIVTLINQAVGEARTLARGLSPLQIETNGLMSALYELAAQVERRTGINCRFQCLHPVLIPDKTIAIHLFRITQEAVNNAIKHGKPQRIDIDLTVSDGLITLCISNDGTGLPERTNSKEGMGLRIMTHRAKLIGANLEVKEQTGHGIVVSCSLPAKQEAPS
jgi:PAS domain S-box-containing protein